MELKLKKIKKEHENNNDNNKGEIFVKSAPANIANEVVIF